MKQLKALAMAVAAVAMTFTARNSPRRSAVSDWSFAHEMEI